MVVPLKPPISTATWYDAPPPGARGRFSSAQVSTLERVRSQVTGTLLVTVAPAGSVATMLLGFSWQSVDVHQTSDPLDTVSLWVVDPTSIAQSVEPRLVSEIDSCGMTPGSYASASVTAATSTSLASHATIPGVSSADDSGAGDSAAGDSPAVGSVSYTHLTLPTKA